MKLEEVYKTEEYKYIADQIEDHERAIVRLVEELKRTFQNEECAKNRSWMIMGDYRPYLRTVQYDTTLYSDNE